MTKDVPQLLIADLKGKIYNIEQYQAAGMKGGCFFPLSGEDLIKLPAGSEMFALPERVAAGYAREGGGLEVLSSNLLTRAKEPCLAVAAFISPGYTVTFSAAYKELGKSRRLPLFAYAACAFYKGEFYAAAVQVDKERRQDLRLMDMEKLKKNVRGFKQLFPGNRLIRHLEGCALVYSCPAAKNFFLRRYEAPLPSSPYCNAYCRGCLSYQPGRKCPVTQPRITFIPRPQEIAQTAVFHLKNARDAVVSFGQGCEGEPLLVGDVLREAVRLIRKETARGIINLNTNGSKPEVLSTLFTAGLDSVRVSLNSVRKAYYTRYYQPRGYAFADVLRSIELAREKKRFVSINYLTMPGFTDSEEEFSALRAFLERYPIDMIQWRNLNYDPLDYVRLMGFPAEASRMLGVRQVIQTVKKEYPRIMPGYFNPSKRRMDRYASQ